jgi:hypothetical protein
VIDAAVAFHDIAAFVTADNTAAAGVGVGWTTSVFGRTPSSLEGVDGSCGTHACMVVSSLLSCWMFAASTCVWNAASNVVRTLGGIRESISFIDAGAGGFIVMIGVYRYSRMMLSSF